MADYTQGERRLGRPAAMPDRRPGAFDISTLAALAGAAVMIAGAVALGGAPAAFVDLPSVLIVLGGTLAVTIMSYPVSDVTRAQQAMLKALVTRPVDPAAAAQDSLRLAEAARERGPMHLQGRLPEFADRPFLQRALSMVIDGSSPQELERTMSSEINATAQRHARSSGVLRRASEVAPAMGLIGTLVGLVQMLGNLDDPATIGPSMAVALLTTFYGALLANVVFAPLAGKLDRNAAAESLASQVYLLGALSICRQENPRRLEMLINTILPPAQKIRYFD
ncbi:MAG: flagellar motor protein MotA [Alphaproteobacteria bacterium]|nr:MAG: flagellar motor protein MotA [Alphaproteobacteria bacterium]